MGWLDVNPSGRLLNRMSDDQNKVDSMLPFAVGSVFSTLFAFAGDMLAVTFITRYLIFMIFPIFLLYFWVMSRYLNASREIQRLISVTQSPALTYMTECSAGIFVIRSFGEETINRLVNKNVDLIDLNSQMVYIMNSCTSWFVFRTEILGDVILLCITTIVFLGSSFLTPGMVGLSISYGLSISSELQSLGL
jgi:ABC-type multidrug transport system fused ATPase/permease subunit